MKRKGKESAEPDPEQAAKKPKVGLGLGGVYGDSDSDDEVGGMNECY